MVLRTTLSSPIRAIRALAGALAVVACLAAPAAAEDSSPSPTPSATPSATPSLDCLELGGARWERGKWIKVSGTTASVDCVLGTEIADPLAVQLAVFVKDDGSHWPTNQTLYKYDIKTLQAPGEYHWEVQLPTSAEKVCASQVDFFRGGTVIPKLLDTGWDQLGFNNIIDGMQYDQPDSPPCNNPTPTPTPTATSGVAGTTVSSTGAGTLPATGYDPAPWLAVAMALALTGAALVAFSPVKAVK